MRIYQKNRNKNYEIKIGLKPFPIYFNLSKIVYRDVYRESEQTNCQLLKQLARDENRVKRNPIINLLTNGNTGNRKVFSVIIARKS